MTKGKTSKQISCKVRTLDDQELPFHIDVSIKLFYLIFYSILSIINLSKTTKRYILSKQRHYTVKSFIYVYVFGMPFDIMVEVNCLLHTNIHTRLSSSLFR